MWRYPVKSLQGERLEAAIVEPDGLLGDRRWGIRDLATGRILTGRRRPELLAAASSYAGSTPVVTLPDERVLEGPGEVTDRALSDWLGSPVSLVPAARRTTAAKPSSSRCRRGGTSTRPRSCW